MSSEDIIVFLGPSLPREEAATILPATYLPPAQQGSVMRAWLGHRPLALVLIDGAFASVPAVRHKEILWACALGLPVFGAASIGAIRAAELAMFGMQGHGLIYRWYRRTPLADDDEVAVAMSPPELGAAPLSEALISMRLTLSKAQREQVLTIEEKLWLEEIARATPFADRSYARLVEDARTMLHERSGDVLARLERWLPRNRIDQKRSDAIGLLTHIAQNINHLKPGQPCPPFRLTESWAHDLESDGLWDIRIAEATGGIEKMTLT